MANDDYYGGSASELLTTALRARVDAWSAGVILDEARENQARVLLQAGVTLIPSEHLQDNQFVVSRGVYEAAKRLTERVK